MLRSLRRDVAATVGSAHEPAVLELAAQARSYLPDDQVAVKVVEDTQQYLHDTRIDTTWPACPRHGNHPLRFRDGSWYCERDAVTVAPLGGLPATGI